MENAAVEAFIVVHARENRRKCSVEPLRLMPRFRFVEFTRREGDRIELRPKLPASDLDRCVRLGFGAPPLSKADRDRPLLVLDATWRLVAAMERHFASTPVRSLPSFATAYPRASKTLVDPVAGLATVEAIYAAFAILGRSTEGILDDYRWREEFLSANALMLNGL